MPILKLGNSYSQLEGLTVEQYRRLKTAMSYTVDSGPGTRPRTVSLLSKKLEFPTGLEYLVDFPVEVVDTRARPTALPDAPQSLFIPGRAPTPYSAQKAAVEAVIASDGRGIVVAPTGTGKSLKIALTIDAFKVKTLVVVPRVGLKNQLTRSLIHWFGKTNFDQFVQVANIDSLDPGKQLTGFGMIIVDELHHVAAKTYRDLNRKAWNDVYHRVGFTATAFRSDENERLLFESFLSKEVYRIPYSTAVKQQYIVPLECYYLEIPKTPLVGNKAHYGSMYSQCIVDYDHRNTMVAVALARLHGQKKVTLCLVKEIRHGEILSSKTGFPFANGKDGMSEQLIKAFNEGSINTLIATCGVCGEGTDTVRAEWVIVAGAGKAKTQLMQMLGRVFRNYPGKKSGKALLLFDKSHEWFRKHFREQFKILKEEYGIEPSQITL